MNRDERRERLRRRTEEVARTDGRLAEAAEGRPPAAGHLYVLPVTRDLPVEWVLLEPRPTAGEGATDWLAVPADTHPAAGPGDVRIAASEAAGPLVLRCRFAAPLPHEVLAAGRRTGEVPAEAVRAAAAAHRAHRSGTLRPPPSALEVADDSEYRDWEREVLAPASEAVRRAGSPGHRSATPPWVPLLAALAAGLALVCVGLGVWSSQLRTDLETASSPVVLGRSNELPIGVGHRAPVPLEVRPGEEHLLVFVLLEDDIADHPQYRIELSTPDGRTLWSSRAIERGPVPELSLVVPRRFLGDRESFELGLYAVEPGGDRLLAEAPFRIEERPEG